MIRPALHRPSVRGRARADAGPLLLVAAVVAVVTLLAGAAPPLLRATADDAVRDAARTAGRDGDVLAHARWEYDDAPDGGRIRAPRLAEDVDDFRERATEALDPGLRAVLRPPVAVVTSPTLKVTEGTAPRTFRLAYLVDGRGPHSQTRVTWVAGSPPAPSVPPERESLTVPYGGPPWPVQIGLSEVDAAELGVRPGDRIPLVDEFRRAKDVQVSGVFRAEDSGDPTWRLAPWLLRPVAGADGVGTTRLGGLLSPGSLPDARLAFDQDELDRAVRFSPEPGALDSGTAEAVTGTLVTLKATSGASSVQDTSLKWETQLDLVLREVQTRVNAASAQASVLLAAVLTGAVLVLLLAADLLARRRTQPLAAARQRGTGLPDLAAELLVESAAVALVAAGVGLALARLVAPGVSWWWAVPVALAAAAAGPGFGTLHAARATRDRRAPANRAARRWLAQTRQLRGAAVEVAVLVAAAAALVALHQRGILPAPAGGAAGPWSTSDGEAALPSSAPALGAVAGALALLRLLPAGTRAALRWALRSRRPLAAFGAARAAATASHALPPLAMVAAAALAAFALTLGATADRGLADGAWRTVGADARLDANPAAGVDMRALAGRVAASPGVRQAVAAQVVDGARVTTESALVTPRLVVVDAAAFRRLLATTPLPDAPDLARLGPAGPGGVPALVRSGDGSLRPGMRLRLPRDGDAEAVPLTAVGTAPAVGGTGDVVVVDAAALTAAGVPVVPNTVWVTGPGTARAVAAGTDGVDTVLRAGVLHERRGAPLTAGLLRLAWTSAAVLLALGLLGLALGAAEGAPERWQTLSRLRTLGLRLREARWVAAGELLPPVAVAAIGGPLLGVLLAYLTAGPLALRVVVGAEGDPPVAVPWWGIAPLAAAFLAAVAVVVPVEAAVRRRRRLGEVLRAGAG
ncbi:ABC transporter permease [Phytohabitans sp. ZYX-F-186]|uniref:ABC transporter permease n=1 Tax=Phytohabitans maris TaxID=3071409 RepID=A0ABU0ZAI0_9ACTN|nr:FtsX-like permease family protein [Phytohabitans sp. ZYX-F-186]MDQ7904068.1 ABC transporter permease [Phytohabitans sp. ZYX-F-186]